MRRKSFYCPALLLTGFLLITFGVTQSIASQSSHQQEYCSVLKHPAPRLGVALHTLHKSPLEGRPLSRPLDRFAASQGIMPADSPSDAPGGDEGEDDLESLKEELQKLKDFLESIPESDAAKKFKKALERLGNEIEILEKSFRNTIEKEIIPWLKKEIERLKKELYRYFEEPDENQPKKVNLPRPEKVSGEVVISCPCV